MTHLLHMCVIFISLSCHEKAHDNKEFSCENSKPVVNHKSQAIKLNPALHFAPFIVSSPPGYRGHERVSTILGKGEGLNNLFWRGV